MPDISNGRLLPILTAILPSNVTSMAPFDCLTLGQPSATAA
jgi:hypothetical protein